MVHKVEVKVFTKCSVFALFLLSLWMQPILGSAQTRDTSQSTGTTSQQNSSTSMDQDSDQQGLDRDRTGQNSGSANELSDRDRNLNVQPYRDLDRARDQATDGSKFCALTDEKCETRFTSQRKLLPEELPTEFQVFVSRALGQKLPIFGAQMFEINSRTPILENVPASADYVVGPGDEIQVRLWGAVTADDRLIVDRSGDIFIPHVGQVHVAGLRFDQIRSQVNDSVSRVYRNFDLSVQLGQLHSVQVFVTGRVRMPGALILNPMSTIVSAIYAAGGPRNDGSMRSVELSRDGKHVATLDLYDMLTGKHTPRDVRLLPGDTIYVPAVGQQVAITGSVNSPAIYEIADHESIGDLIQMAGGPSTTASHKSIYIDRLVDHTDRTAISVPFDASGMKMPLQGGDMVHLDPITGAFEKTVTIRGNVANVGRYQWFAGMRLSDLLPEPQALLTANYWYHRNALGRPNTRVVPLERARDERTMSNQVGVGSRVADAAVSQTSGRSNMTNRMPNSIPDRSVGQESNENRSEESVHAQSAYKNEITLPAPEINWSYAVIERTTPSLRNELVPFRLGRLIFDHDLQEDLPLQPGDVVTIFSQGDFSVAMEQQTKYVRIEGEVKSSGVYSVKPGENLRDLLIRAGGLTDNSYLYATQFLRESVRYNFQQALTTYVDRYASESQRKALSLSLAQTSTSSTGTDALQSYQAAIISQLRAQHGTGRVVFAIKPTAKTIDEIPNLALEDGDRIIIPAKPATVSVVGSVYTPSSFLMRGRTTVGDFMHEAGGPDRNADPKNSYVLRANGTVFSKSQSSSVRGNSFSSSQVSPGDTIVVPAKLPSYPALRSVIEWAQVIANLGISAAVITR